MSSLACRQCGQPIKFDDKRVSQRTGKKIPLDPTLMNTMTVRCEINVGQIFGSLSNKVNLDMGYRICIT